MDIVGKWEGYYEYGEGYFLPQFGERVKFTITFNGANDDFTGFIKEEESANSVPLKAIINGFSKENFISFIKKYPKLYRFKEEGSNEKIIENKEPEIEYEGFIDTNNKAIYGSWFFSEMVKDEHGTFESISSGIWFLKQI